MTELYAGGGSTERTAGDRPVGAVFVNQASRAGLVGPLASWITVAGWAGAARRRYGHAWMVTPEGILDPDEALERAARPARAAEAVTARRVRVPQVARTAVNDLRRLGANRRFRDRFAPGPWQAAEVRFVLALHGLLWDAGLREAEHLGVPSVLVVDAVQVEEARAWGVHRPGWTRLAIRVGEVPQLRRADLVACVSDEVRESVLRWSGRREGVVTLPNGVDTERFRPGPGDPGRRRALGLDGAFVVGWAGSFRRFHGLDPLVDAVARLRGEGRDARLLLLGDGLGRPALETRARVLGVPVTLPGTMGPTDLPAFLRCADAAVVLGEPGRPFHYSPVKLREYQACGLPVVAAATGELARELRDGVDARLVAPGDVTALTDALRSLQDDPDGARALGAAGRARVEATGSWASRLLELEGLLGLG